MDPMNSAFPDLYKCAQYVGASPFLIHDVKRPGREPRPFYA